MKHSSKILVNTVALYFKIIFNAIVSVFATRIVLRQLGVDDYGLYNLIAGTILLLSFLNGSMMISAQRFMSIAIGEKNQEKLKKIFNVSTYIHIIISIGIGIVLLILQQLLLNGVLDTGNAPMLSVHIVYDIMVISSILTIATIPYSAAINAHEDMHFFAISEIIVIIFKFVAALSLIFITKHKLVLYTLLMMFSVFVGYITKLWWCKRKYDECILDKHLMRDKAMLKEMTGFVGWNTLGSLAVVIRNQGVAFVLNIFFGVVVNAAYGIANQVNSLVLTFASTLTTVFTPSIIQSKGSGDEERMRHLALLSSKLSFLLSSIMSIPILLFLPDILKLWLGDYPVHTISFCNYIIITFLILQLYPGINRLIYATGRIKAYQISISITLISVLPIGFILFLFDYPPEAMLIALAAAQFITLIETVFFAHKYAALELYDTIVRYLIPTIIIFVIVLVTGKAFTLPVAESGWWTMLAQVILIESIYILAYISVVFNKQEKNKIFHLIKKNKR